MSDRAGLATAAPARRWPGTRLAWTMCGLSWAMAFAAMVLAAVNGLTPHLYIINHYAIGTVTAIFYPLLGALIVRRDRRSLLGWLLCVVGIVLGVFVLSEEYAPLALGLSKPGVSLPGGAFVAWLTTWTNLPGIVIGTVSLPLLFPDGHLPTRRWLPVAWLAVVVAVVPTTLLAVAYWPLSGPRLVTQSGVEPGWAANLFAIGFIGALLLTAAAVVSLVQRFRRAGAVARQQIKWFALGAGASVFLGAFAMTGPIGAYVELGEAALLLAGLGIGVFRYRLWEIDRLLNRTLVYGLLTAILGGAYAIGVLVIGHQFSPGRNPSSLVVAATTLAVAALFQPMRNTIQRLVDRRFNRRRYDAAKTIDDFAARLRQQIDLEALGAELLAVVDATVQPTSASLWLRQAKRAEGEAR